MGLSVSLVTGVPGEIRKETDARLLIIKALIENAPD
jgi:hypothetical protein